MFVDYRNIYICHQGAKAVIWMLFTILIDQDRYWVQPQGPYKTAEECNEVKAFFLAAAPSPKINYGAVCIKSDEITGET